MTVTAHAGDHPLRREFAVASWPPMLKAISTIGTAVTAAAGVAAYRSIPSSAGFTHSFGLIFALVLPALLAGCLLTVVSGYAIDNRALYVRRLLWWTRIPLEGLTGVRFDPPALKHSLRVFGNGGLFAFAGRYTSQALGSYRLFGTDVSRAVVLTFRDRTVVITPAAPAGFVEYMRARLQPPAT